MTTAWGGQPPNLNGAAQTHWGASSIGILGSVMQATWTAGQHGPSPLANDGLASGLEYRWYVESLPAGCSIVATELGDAELTVSADGSYTWTYRLVESGALLARVNSVSTVVGAAPAALAATVAGQAVINVTMVATGAVVASLSLMAAVAGQAGFTVTMSGTGAVVATVAGGGTVGPVVIGTPGRYTTPAAYIQRFGLAEAVELLSDEQRLLTATLLQDAMSGAWSGTPSTAEQAAATDALARMQRQIDVSCAFIDGYLAAVATLPLPTDTAQAGTLVECALALTRFDLADDSDNATDRIDEAAKTWRAWLRDVSAGKVQLVASSGSTNSTRSGRVRSGQATSRFDWASFGGVR